ncbi:hypothetical protein R70723_28205 [Paenibacillus sp. FSL R7-0273]|nr:hypothetical protein R70723_28205 [Paenibacillus sp. FSL R7-0273]OMF87979.1 hypothetical protein BK144_22470 [Paenibacillus sp. FSL R7-0273]
MEDAPEANGFWGFFVAGGRERACRGAFGWLRNSRECLDFRPLLYLDFLIETAGRGRNPNIKADAPAPPVPNFPSAAPHLNGGYKLFRTARQQSPPANSLRGRERGSSRKSQPPVDMEAGFGKVGVAGDGGAWLEVV